MLKFNFLSSQLDSYSLHWQPFSLIYLSTKVNEELDGKTLLHKFLCQKGLQCHICQKNYSSDANLKDHIKNVHQNEQYPCENCGKIFKSKTYLKSHLKLAHLDTTQHFRQERKTLFSEKLFFWFFSMQEDGYFCYWICDFPPS